MSPKSNNGGHKKHGKRGRKASRIDMKAKLERSRQSARECRARKKLRYQYLEELVSARERSILALRAELEKVKKICPEVDTGNITDDIKDFAKRVKRQIAEDSNAPRPSRLTHAEDDDDDDSFDDDDDDDDDFFEDDEDDEDFELN